MSFDAIGLFPGMNQSGRYRTLVLPTLTPRGQERDFSSQAD